MTKNIRWVCKSCEKKWIHPVENCIYCGKSVEKEIGTKLKVIGASQVFIPSPNHLKVPYYVLMLEDEHGNRMPRKTMKEYKIGDQYVEEPSSDPHAVSIVKIKYDYYEAVKEAFELIGGIDITAQKNILIKPEIVAKAYPYMALNTNPKVLDALIEVLISMGAKKENITVAENNHYVEMDAALGRTEIGKVIKKHGVNFVDLSKTEFEKKKVDDYEFEITKEIQGKDLIINLPIVKTNSLLGITGGIENLTRLISKSQFDELKESPMDALQAMAVIPKAFPNLITLSDASVGIHGNAPLDGEPAFLGLILAGKDVVAVDKVFGEIGCFKPADHVEMAAKFDVGTSDMSNIIITGADLDSVKRKLIPASRRTKNR